jgi:hypothetical protein
LSCAAFSAVGAEVVPGAAVSVAVVDQAGAAVHRGAGK